MINRQKDKLNFMTCRVCENPKTEAHHDDYNKPLEIRWLCFDCHRKWHKTHDNPELLKGE